MPNTKYEVISLGGGRQGYAHHAVLPKRAGYDVDHINGDTKDNRPENLRYLTRAQNAVRRFREDAGVDFHKATQKWRARYRTKYLGLFATRDEAMAARQAALHRDMEDWL